MVNIKDTQKKIDFDSKKYTQDAEKIIQYLGYPDFSISFWLTTNPTIKKYNRLYRNKDKATDILSFPFHDVVAGKKIKANSEDEKNLGDIIISLQRVQADAKKFGVTFEQRMNRLLVHGICHLLGYDHIKDADYKIMYALETKLMKHIDCFVPDY